MAPPEFEDDADAFLQSSGLRHEVSPGNTPRPWMMKHRFRVVTSVEETASIVDQAIAHGRVAIDTECEGLDTRVYYNENGKPFTVHKIVGYCLCIDGITGYYIPVGHVGEGEEQNVDREGVEKEISRLCWASQPKPKPGEPSPLNFRDYAEPGKVKVYFWHAKFDQEMLFPVTGLDWWHPDSFEDGMLMAYCLYTDDEIGLKKQSRQLSAEGPTILEPNLLRLDYKSDPGFVRVRYDGTSKGITRHPYTMIEMKDLFPKGRKVQFGNLVPSEGLLYASSDAIVTYLLTDKEANPTLYSESARLKTDFIYRIEKQVVQVLRRMERSRVRLDREAIASLETEALRDMGIVETKVKNLAQAQGFGDIDINSAKQMGEFFFEDRPGCLNLSPKPPKTESSGQWSTASKAIEAIAEEMGAAAPEIFQDYLYYKDLQKVVGTYLSNMLAGMDANGEVRVNFVQTGAATGRFTAPGGKPENGECGFPVHGIPSKQDADTIKAMKELRRAFMARDNYIFAKTDYAAEELRIAVNLSGEPRWLEEFRNGTGDLHTLTAKAIFGKEQVSKDERKIGKCVHPDTVVLTRGGWVPIKDLAPFAPTEDTFLQLPPKTVWVHNGQDFVPVKATYNGGVKPLVRIVTRSTVVITAHTHLFQCVDGTWLQAHEIQEGDTLATGGPHLRTRPREEVLAEIQGFLNHDLSNFYRDFKGRQKFSLRGFQDTQVQRLALCLQEAGFTYSLAVRPENPHLNLFLTAEYAKNDMVLRVEHLAPGPCLDLETDDEKHLYLAQGYVTHNTVNFALLYGGGAAAVVRACGCAREEGQRKKANFDKSVPGWTEWSSKKKRQVKMDKGVYTAFGRWLSIPHAVSEDNAERAAAERHAINYSIQGTGADIMKIALVLCHQEAFKRGWLRDWCRPEGPDNFDIARMILTVHDEIGTEVLKGHIYEVVSTFKACMEKVASFVRGPKWSIPLVAEPSLGDAWAAKYEWSDLTEGHPYKAGDKVGPGQFVHEGRIYAVPPDYLQEISIYDPAVHKKGESPSGEDAPIKERKVTPLPEVPQEAKVKLRLNMLTQDTAAKLAILCSHAANPEGNLLIVEDDAGNLLVTEDDKVRVDPHLARAYHRLLCL